jgi:hypothetical protein
MVLELAKTIRTGLDPVTIDRIPGDAQRAADLLEAAARYVGTLPTEAEQGVFSSRILTAVFGHQRGGQ